MANTKINFGAMGEAEVINNYKLTEEDLKNSEEIEETYLEEEDDEAEKYMSIAQLKSKMKKKSSDSKNILMNREDKPRNKSINTKEGPRNAPMNKIEVNSDRENSGHSRSPSKLNKKMGRQVTSINSAGNESLRRTYLIEIANIKRLEEIKVYLYAH
ncbi:MAG: hypothetical protein RR620_12715, partial [Clostridium sp.]